MSVSASRSTDDALADIYAEADRAARSSYLGYLSWVVVDSQPDPLAFALAAESWQWDRERVVSEAIEQLARFSRNYRGPKRFWRGYAKGHDKTTGVARRVNFLLKYARRPLAIYVCAGDREQAGLVSLAMRRELDRNPWLADGIELSAYGASGASGSELTILATDAATGQGIFPDYLIADEVTHWKHEAGRAFWDSMMSSVNKRPHCILEVCTNAGHKGSWQWGLRNFAAGSSRWHFYEQPVRTQLASWMDAKSIADDRLGMDPGEARRLFDNEWIDPGEESGYLSLAEAEGCVDRSLQEKTRGESGVLYYAIVDYGGVDDRCALAVLHAVPGTDRAVIDRLDCWQGSHANRIQINVPDGDPHARCVENWVEDTRRRFPLAALVVDPHQLEGLAIKSERKGIRVIRFEYLAGKNNYRMAQLLRTMVQSKKLTWSPDAGRLSGAEDDTFAKELAMLVKVSTSYGYRFDHTSGRHDDRAAAVGMGLIHAMAECPPIHTVPQFVDVPRPPSPLLGGGYGGERTDWASRRG
ncbi:MAG TPA: hypothetical protein VKE74_12220, partial [Gemmataceae bacterium]|nr:hypothetical protein [Gemmataceae bacterium]